LEKVTGFQAFSEPVAVRDRRWLDPREWFHEEQGEEIVACAGFPAVIGDRIFRLMAAYPI
jgi:hypothetical protein